MCFYGYKYSECERNLKLAVARINLNETDDISKDKNEFENVKIKFKPILWRCNDKTSGLQRDSAFRCVVFKSSQLYTRASIASRLQVHILLYE